MAEAVRPRSSTKPAKLPDMTGWNDEQIAEFWETHDSTDYLDQEESDEASTRGQAAANPHYGAGIGRTQETYLDDG